MTKITFLGTGGGRFATVYQVRRTGGIYLEDGARVHIDPGPGAALALRERRMDPARTDALLISHCHPDHYGDAEVLVEGMTACSFSRRGVLAGSRSAISGHGDFGPAVSEYHKSIVPKSIVMVPGDELVVKRLRIRATRTSHSDPDGIGFRFMTRSGDVSFVGDTELRQEVLDDHRGAKVLIMNVTRPLRSRVRFHLSTEDAAEMAKELRPDMAVLTHFGSKFIHDGVQKQVDFVVSESGVRTIAARDFMALHVGERIRVRGYAPGQQ
ncbi:MAG TPA: MBL fold metallo-hydrolase [Methanomassiliicoccales archaeon]|nr:MBL fold metallo-hydrolase [Methanomassiliicoccales archaeon]